MTPSYDQADLDHFSFGDSVATNSRFAGVKAGGGRGVFSATGGKATGTFSTGLTVPKGCTVSRVVYKVLTSFESGSDAATIALTIEAANDVKSALALSDGSNIWDAATLPVVCVPVTATLSTWLTTTADRALNAVVGVEALTSGKLVVFAEWYYWGDLTLT